MFLGEKIWSVVEWIILLSCRRSSHRKLNQTLQQHNLQLFYSFIKDIPKIRILKCRFFLVLDSLPWSGKITFVFYYGTLYTKMQKLYVWVESKYWVLCISMCIYIWKMQSQKVKKVGIVCILSRYGRREFCVCVPGFETFKFFFFNYGIMVAFKTDAEVIQVTDFWTVYMFWKWRGLIRAWYVFCDDWLV